MEFRSHRRPLSPLVVVSILLAVFLAFVLVSRFTRRVDSVLKDSRQAILQKRTVPLTARRIVPQSRPGYSLWPSAERASGLAWFQEHLYATSNLGLLQLNTAGQITRRYGVLEGFPGNRLHSLVKTANALWMGVFPQGLLRFDGDQFEFYTADRSQDFEVTCLLPLDSGGLLVGTRQRGLLVFRDGSAEEFSPRLNKSFITCLNGNDRQLAIGTYEEGLFLYQQGLLTQVSKQAGSPGTLTLIDNQVTALAGDDHDLFVGSPLGISQVTAGQVVSHLEAGLNVRSLALDSQLLAGTDTGVVIAELKTAPRLARAHLSQSTSEALTLSSLSRVGLAINSFLRIQDEWLAATDNGVFRFRDTTGNVWKRFGSATDFPDQPILLSKHQPAGSAGRLPSASPLTDANISALALDQDQRLWVGYFDRGLDLFDARGQRLRHYEDDRLFCVNHVLLQPGGSSVVSTANGIVFFQGDQVRHVITEKEGLMSRSVTMTLPLGTPRQLLAATSEGISFLDKDQPFRNMNAFHGLASNHVYSAAQLGSRVFIGTLAGLSVFEDSQVLFSWTMANSGLTANWVNALAICHGKLFVGTYGGGVQSVDTLGQWLDYSQHLGKFEVNPNAMVAEGDLLFTGTLDRGFYVYHAIQDEWRQVIEALPSLNVTSFAAGPSFVLVGTDNGLVRIEKSEILKLF